MAKKSGDVHVSKDMDKGGWKVTQDGDRIAGAKTQTAAVDKGKKEAKKDGVDLVTHGVDGKVKSKDSYGNDPRRIKDTEH